MITQLKELLKKTFNFLLKIVLYVVIAVLICVYSLLLWNTYDYYNSDKYKYALAHQVYDNLILYTGQTVPPLVIINNPVVNAWTDGLTITFTTGILHELKNEDEIANIMAHEIAHNMLAHTYDDDSVSTLKQIDKEAHADKVGVYLMLRAGYDVCKAKNVWLNFRESDIGEMADPGDHPSYSYRYYQEQMPWCK